MVLYMEQYVIITYSNLTSQPAMVPLCEKPDTKSCDWMKCYWNESSPAAKHQIQLLPCAKPQAFRLIIDSKEAQINETFDQSRVTKMVGGISLNVTVKHPNIDTLGIQVDVITENGAYTEIAYTELPLETHGCPPSSRLPSLPRMNPRPHHTATLYKQGRKALEEVKGRPKNMVAMGPIKSQPLDNTCDIFPHLAEVATKAVADTMMCKSSPPPCDSIVCTILSNNDTLVFKILPCHAPPAILLADSAADETLKFNRTFFNTTKSVEAPIGSNPVFLNVTIVQHQDMKTLGVEIKANVDANGQRVDAEFIPYTEIPLNRTKCSNGTHSMTQHSKPQLGANNTHPRPLVSLCGTVPQIATALNSSLTGYFMCQSPPPPMCGHIHCANRTTGQSVDVRFVSCSTPPAVYLNITNREGVSRNYTITQSGIVNIDIASMTIPLQFTVAQRIDFLTMGLQVDELSGNSTLLPYFEIPLNRSNCPGVVEPSPTCAALNNIAAYLTVRTVNLTDSSIWDCSVDVSCDTVMCSAGNGTFYSILISPCNHAVTVSYVSPNVSFMNTFERSGQVLVDNTTLLNVQMQYNATTSTLGLQMAYVFRDAVNHSFSLSFSFLPYVRIPLNFDSCSPDNGPLIGTCDLFPHVARELTEVQPGLLDCTSSPPPDCNSVVCQVPPNDTLSLQLLPCHMPPAIQLVNKAGDKSVRFNQTFVNTTNFVQAHIGDDLVSMNITVQQHKQRLTLGVAVIAALNGSSPVDFLPYHEMPLDRTNCMAPNISSTCQAMNQVAQAVNVFVTNITHRPNSYCHVTQESLCHGVACMNTDMSGSFNMSFLPCGDRIGFNIVSGNDTHTLYNFTVFNSTMVHFSDSVYGDITLEQELGSTDVIFQLGLYFTNNSLLGLEVPRVVVPMDKEICKTKPPPPATNDTIDFSPLVTTCDIFPHMAEVATSAVANTMMCESSSSPCKNITCNVGSNNDTLVFQVLPCHTPPAILLTNSWANGTLKFNHTFINSTTKSVEAQIGSNPVYLNITIVQHRDQRTLGVEIEANVDSNGERVDALFIPYTEIPLDQTKCPSLIVESDTCRVMNNVGQYEAVFFSSFTQTPVTCRALRGPPYFCNTLRCNATMFTTDMTLLACSNPIGVRRMFTINGENNNITIFDSGTYNVSRGVVGEYTLEHLDNDVIGLQLSVRNQSASGADTFMEIPYVRIPVNTSHCDNTNTNGSHTHYPSLLDPCDVMPYLADMATQSLDGATCSSSDCHTISCVESGLNTGRMWSLTILSCWNGQFSPSVRVTVTNSNGTLIRPSERLQTSKVVPLDANNSLSVKIVKHKSDLSIGFQLSGSSAGRNKTIIPYVEIPTNRSACPAPVVPPICEKLRNVSQYANFILSNVTQQSVECVPSKSCDSVTCDIGRNVSTQTISIDHCGIPPSIQLAVASPNGTFNKTIEGSEILEWNLMSMVLTLNVTVLHFTSDTIGLQVSLEYPGSYGPILMVPMVFLPINTTGCSSTPTYKNDSLIETCDITPYIATSVFTPPGVSTIQCIASSPPNCSVITCSIPGTLDSMQFSLKPCYSPPAINVVNVINGSVVLDKTTAHSVKFNFSTAKVPMVMELTQHTNMMSVGFKVDVLLEETTFVPFIPYREIPIDHYECSGAILTPTCRVMGQIAQYMTVFIANATTDAGSTPDCYPDRHTFCNNITCTQPSDGQRYDYSFFSCDDPIVFTTSRSLNDGTFLDSASYSQSQQIVILGQYDARLTLNSLDDNLVQFKIESTSDRFPGTFVPMVNIPLDEDYCRSRPHSTTAGSSTSGSTTSSTTAAPVTQNNKLIIAVAAPVGAVLLIIVAVVFAVLGYYCCCAQKKSNEPYAFRPLADQEEGSSGEEDEITHRPPEEKEDEPDI